MMDLWLCVFYQCSNLFVLKLECGIKLRIHFFTVAKFQLPHQLLNTELYMKQQFIFKLFCCKKTTTLQKHATGMVCNSNSCHVYVTGIQRNEMPRDFSHFVK